MISHPFRARTEAIFPVFLAVLLLTATQLPANQRAIFSYSLSLGEAAEEGSATRWFFSGLAADGVTPLFEEKEEENSPGDLVFSGELFPVTVGQGQYRSGFFEIAEGIGIVEHGVLEMDIADWPGDGGFPDFLRIDQPGDFTAQGTWTPTLTSAAPADVRVVFERTAGDRQGTYRVDFLANTSAGIAVLGDPAHHYAAPETAGNPGNWEDVVGSNNFILPSPVEAVEVSSAFEAIPFAYQLTAPYGSTEGGQANSFNSSFSSATGSIEIWFQHDFGSIPENEKQVIFESGGNANGLSLLAEQSAEDDPLLRILQSENAGRTLDITLNLAGEAGYAGLSGTDLADFIQCVLRFDGSTEELSIVINGTVAKTVSTVGISSLCGANDAAIFYTSGDIESHLGGRGDEGGYDALIAQFTGKIADLRIYPTALETEDAQGNFNAMKSPGVARSISGDFWLPKITADGASTTTGAGAGQLGLTGMVEDGGGSAILTGSADYTRNGAINLSEVRLERDEGSGGAPALGLQDVSLTLTSGFYSGQLAVDDGNQATTWPDYQHFFMELPATAPVISNGPSSQEVTAGEPLELRVEATGLFVTYEWFHGGEKIPGADSPTYTVTYSGSAHAGDYYVRLITDTGQVESDAVTNSILPPDIRCQLLPDETQPESYVLTWNSYPGQTYQVRESSHLNGWNDLGDPIAGTGAMLEKTLIYSSPAPTQYFYHIITTY